MNKHSTFGFAVGIVTWFVFSMCAWAWSWSPGFPPPELPPPDSPPPGAFELGCGNEDTPPCESCDAVGTSSIKPFRANKQRHVMDLETYSTAPIHFTRIYNSRTTDFTTNYMEFGWKQTWQHNWNYELRDQTASTLGHPDVRLRYPSGAEFAFKATDTQCVVRAPVAFWGDRLFPWANSTNVGHTLVTPNGTEFDFQRTSYPRYKLIRVRNGQGLTWHLSYDAHARLHKIENDFGRWLEIQRTNFWGRLCISSVSSSDGRKVEYQYETWDDISQTNGILTEVVYPDGTQAEYTYVGAQSPTSGRPLLATAKDPCHSGAGARVRYNYNYDAILNFGSGPYLVTGVVLEERSLDTDEVVVRLPLGAGAYTQVVSGDGVELTFIYTNGLLREIRDGEGRPTYFSRDQNGAGYVNGIFDAETNVTAFIKDYAGRILSHIDPLGTTNQFSYNDAGFLLTHVNPLGNATVYTRNSLNLPTRIDYPDGSFEERNYNANGMPLTYQLRNGGVVAFEYYGTNEAGGMFGDLKTITDPLGYATTYAWNGAGMPLFVTDAKSNTIYYAYDWRGQLLTTTHADSTTTVNQYDSYGNRIRTVDELGHETVYFFDQFNRTQTIRDPLGRTTAYEYGRLPGCGGCGVFEPTVTRITDSAGKLKEYSYDRSGKQTAEVMAAGTPEVSTTAWTYDKVGRKKTQLDAMGNLHTWFYNAADQVVAESNAAGKVTVFTYNATGSVTSRVDGAGIETIVEYNAMNQLVAIGSGNHRYEYAYDLGGRRTAMTTRVNGAIEESTSYAYDPNDRLATKTDPSGYVLHFTYDALGQRNGLSISNVLNISYFYNARRQLTQIGANEKTTLFGYDAAGQLTNAIWPNETRTSYAYDESSQIRSLVHEKANSPNAPIASFVYSYDLGGNRTNVVTLEGTNTYAYDARNWLTKAIYPNGKEEIFAYDLTGNRLHLGGVGSVSTDSIYSSANRLLASATPTETNFFTYDDAGRLVEQTENEQSRFYDYDFLSRMTMLTESDGATFRYAFDGDGNRTKQTLNECLETRFVYDGPNVVLELNASNEVVQAFVNGLDIDQPIERISFINGTPRQRHVFHADAIGSVVALTDSSGEQVVSYSYDSFGRIRSRTGSELNRITFTAREILGDNLGFYYYRNRILDPVSGRFTSEDPIGFDDGPNTFIYVHNNGVNRNDPWGLDDWGWPFNGRLKVAKGCAESFKGIDMDNEKVVIVGPGEKTPWNEDFDFVLIGGKWVKIGAHNFNIGPKGSCPAGFREADEKETRKINDIIGKGNPK